MSSVLQSWVGTVPCKMQSVLMSAIRGCDTVGKEDNSKSVVRSLRSVVLNDVEGKSAFTLNSIAECVDDHGQLTGTVKDFITDLDHYPVHFLMHLCHACEIIGFKHPDSLISLRFRSVYLAIVRALHLLPETEAHLDIRLADKVFDAAARIDYDAVADTVDVKALRAEMEARVHAIEEDFRAREGQIRAEARSSQVGIARPIPIMTHAERVGGYRG